MIRTTPQTEANPGNSQVESAKRQEFLNANPDCLPHPRGKAAEVNAPAKETRKRGRPRKLNEFDRKQVTDMIWEGVSLRRAAVHAGCCPATILNEMRRDPDFAKEIRYARKNAEISLMAKIKRSASKSWRAAAWLLARLDLESKAETALQQEFDELQVELAPKAKLDEWEEEELAGLKQQTQTKN